jgi:hypothetical protein
MLAASESAVVRGVLLDSGSECRAELPPSITSAKHDDH